MQDKWTDICLVVFLFFPYDKLDFHIFVSLDKCYVESM